MKNKSAAALLALICFILGLVISMQYHSQQSIHSDLNQQSTGDLLTILNEMNDNRALLEQQWMEAQSTLDVIQEASTNETVLAKQLKNDSADYAIIIGDSDVEGSGLRITFKETDRLIGSDLVDLLNELWGTGAEAIAVNGIRVTDKTSFQTVAKNQQRRITLNSVSLDFPIVIEATGNSATLQTGISFPGGILERLQEQYGLIPETEEVDTIIIPAATKNQ